MKPTLVIQNCPAESAGSIVDYLQTKQIPYQTVRTYDDETLPDPRTVGAVINLGCPLSVNNTFEVDYLTTLYKYVVELVRRDQPYLGVCFGGQLLARVLGADVKANKVKEIGTYSVQLTEQGIGDPLFIGFPNEFSVFHWHGDTFGIPFGSAHLVKGVDCVNQAFRKGRMVGVQFHLETIPNEVPVWCDEYKDEMIQFGQTKENILNQYSPKAPFLTNLNYQLLDNFYSLS
jgi:GMP synthase-like glutamine amidotransferase